MIFFGWYLTDISIGLGQPYVLHIATVQLNEIIKLSYTPCVKTHHYVRGVFVSFYHSTLRTKVLRHFFLSESL